MTGEPARGDRSALSQVMRIVGTIVAPTTLITAVCYYFGWMFSFWFFDYFGVNSTLLGLTPTDYLIRSVDGLFVPMTVLAFAGLLVLWVHLALRSRLVASWPHLIPVLVPLTAAVGLVLTVLGLTSVFTTTVLSRHLVAAPLSLAAGVLLLEYAVALWRSRQPAQATPAPLSWAAVAEWAAVFVLVGISLFWAATDYAGAVGRSRAHQFADELPTYPNTIVYSRHSLSLRLPGVEEVRCRDAEAAYRFRYDGLKLMLQSSDQYLLLPGRWTPADGAAVLLPRTGEVRLEFTLAGSAATIAC